MESSNTPERRIADRLSTRIAVQVTRLNERFDSQCVDVSATGMCLRLKDEVKLAAGERIALSAETIGPLVGVVRWNRTGRLGLEFVLNSNDRAKLASFFRNDGVATRKSGWRAFQGT